MAVGALFVSDAQPMAGSAATPQQGLLLPRRRGPRTSGMASFRYVEFL